MELSTIRIAWRNLGRNRRRTLLAVGAIALGQLTLVFVNALMAGSFNEMVDTITGPFIGHVQIRHPEWAEERALDLVIDDAGALVAELRALAEVRNVSPRIFAPVLAASGELGDEPAEAEPGVIVGVDIGAEHRDGGILESVPAAQLPGERKVLVGVVLATKLGVGEGQQLAVVGQDADGFPISDLFVIRGLIDSSVDVVKTTGIVMALKDAAEFVAMPDQVHEIVVRGADDDSAAELASTIKTLPSVAGLQVLSWREAVPMMARMIDMKWWVDLVFLGIVFVAAAAGIANTSVMSTFERTHEFGMLLAVGARPRRVVGMVLIESVILGLVGVVIGSLIGVALVVATGHTGIDYAALGGVEAQDVAFGGMSISYVVYPVLELRHIVLGLIAVTVTSVLASLWPAIISARLEPAEALHS